MHESAFRTGLLLLVSCTFVGLLGPGSASAQTRAQYVAAAEPHCASANRDIARLNGRFDELHVHGRYEAAGRVLKKTARRLARSVAQVRAIPPPPGDEGVIKAWLGLIQRIAKNNGKMGRAEEREHFRATDHIAGKNVVIGEKAHHLVADFGFSECVGKA
jgi:hypothetical protein